MARKPAVYTIGHSTHALDEFIALLKHAEVDFLIDVRTIPRSRTNPQFNYDTLPASLATRCHRRIIADYLLAEGYPVFHIMGMGKIEPARMTDAAVKTREGTLRYRG